MISSLLLEAALRSVLLALAVWAGLRIFGVKNVLAQKAAWGLVLVSALAMPLLLPYAAHWSVLPANVRVVIPDDPQTLLEELQARIKTAPKPRPLAEAVVPAAQAATPTENADANLTGDDASETHAAAQVEANPRVQDSPAYGVSEPAPQANSVTSSAVGPLPATTGPRIKAKTILTGIFWFYIAVAGVLILRLLCGLVAALRLLHTAKPIIVDSSIPDAASLKLRSSTSVASPVTICSTIVLPANYETWDSNKLRIVLAHEHSHIRQADFYLQLLAGVYAAAVWFSPLGWWLKRKLSDLAEAISDRAGLEQAADRTAYAQILLEFAAAPRPTLIGVAMARSGSLSRRIERLLNDVSFRQAFAGTRRGLAAVAVVPVALFIATAFVRVEAAGQQTQDKDQVILPTTGVVTPEIIAPPQEPPVAVPTPGAVVEGPPTPALAPLSPEHVVTPKAAEDCAPSHLPVPPSPAHVPTSGVVAPVPPAHVFVSPRVMVLPGTLAHTMALIAPAAPGGPRILSLPQLAPTPPNASMAIIMPPRAFLGDGHRYAFAQNGHSTYIVNNGKKSGYRYYVSNHGDSYAIVRGNGSEHMSFSGDIHTSDIDKARQQAGGKDFLWFTHEGKSYIVDDPATLAQIEAMYKPMEELGRQQEELGKKQEVLGKQQEEIGNQQEKASVPTPDMSKEIAQIEAAMAKLKASQGKSMTQDEFGELQEKLGDLQGRLGEIQGEIGSKQGEFGERMGELGSKMGELGEQMGRLGEQQGKIGEQADQKVKSIIDQSLKNGKARPVQ
jgi:beta-lactamase regulating signal transducer with metallopeptidase domain